MTAPVNEPGVWHRCVDGDYPPVGVDVLAGMWYEDTWLAGDRWRFMQGICRMFKTDSEQFAHCKMQQWQTFGPAHNHITHWCYPPTPPDRL